VSTPPYLLVAEDDKATASLILDLATSLGWEVALAKEGDAALKSFEQREPDILLLDYFMPGTNGLQVLEKVRKAGTQIPVIIMTAASEEGLILEALRLGATDFLRKPFEHLLLLKVILRREFQRYQTRNIQQIVGQRITSHAIEFELENDLNVASGVASYIAATMLQGELGYSLRLGMEELLANAIEHGNLGISFEEKTNALNTGGDWIALLRQRAVEPAYAERRVHLLAQLERGIFEITVRDMGEGFDFTRLPDPLSDENLERPNGRGVYLARQQFDSLEYTGRGNIVKARKRIG
jgi:CheY-like chemotaxis protein